MAEYGLRPMYFTAGSPTRSRAVPPVVPSVVSPTTRPRGPGTREPTTRRTADAVLPEQNRTGGTAVPAVRYYCTTPTL